MVTSEPGRGDGQRQLHYKQSWMVEHLAPLFLVLPSETDATRPGFSHYLGLKHRGVHLGEKGLMEISTPLGTERPSPSTTPTLGISG